MGGWLSRRQKVKTADELDAELARLKARSEALEARHARIGALQRRALLLLLLVRCGVRGRGTVALAHCHVAVHAGARRRLRRVRLRRRLAVPRAAAAGRAGGRRCAAARAHSAVRFAAPQSHFQCARPVR